MSSHTNKTILITGVSRGVGLGFAKVYLQKGWTVIAAVRDLSKLPKLEGKVIPVKIDSSSLTDAKEAIEELKTKHGITRLNIVLANAGHAESFGPARDYDIAGFDRIQQVNVRGPLVLYQAVYPLLQEGDKFVVVSSTLGCNSPEHVPVFGAYGTSKAAVNYLVRNMHFEEPKLTIFSIHPGWCTTDMGNNGAKIMGLEHAPQTVEEVSPAVYSLLESATRESHGGYMWE
ncbi:hypothetical protein IAT38_004094 [Cryptococcus sp. DSM 104549]